MHSVGSLQATISTSQAEIAYIVYPEHWRNGFAKEGVIRLLDYLRTEAGVTKAVANIDHRNVASIALIRSVGFKERSSVSTEEGHDIVFVNACRPVLSRFEACGRSDNSANFVHPRVNPGPMVQSVGD